MRNKSRYWFKERQNKHRIVEHAGIEYILEVTIKTGVTKVRVISPPNIDVDIAKIVIDKVLASMKAR